MPTDSNLRRSYPSLSRNTTGPCIRVDGSGRSLIYEGRAYNPVWSPVSAVLPHDDYVISTLINRFLYEGDSVGKIGESRSGFLMRIWHLLLGPDPNFKFDSGYLGD